MSPTKLETHKSLLRNKLKQFIKKIPGGVREKKSEAIVRQVLEMKDFAGAGTMMTYVALSGEPQTEELIFKSWALGKRVYVPFINLRKQEIEIYEIKHWKDLRKGSYGILEPRRLKSLKGNPKDLDLILVPGVAFDKTGRRLGRGGGYFDKFLKKTKRAKKIGLAFREQIIKQVPVGAYDVRMDFVITD